MMAQQRRRMVGNDRIEVGAAVEPFPVSSGLRKVLRGRELVRSAYRRAPERKRVRRKLRSAASRSHEKHPGMGAVHPVLEKTTCCKKKRGGLDLRSRGGRITWVREMKDRVSRRQPVQNFGGGERT